MDSNPLLFFRALLRLMLINILLHCPIYKSVPFHEVNDYNLSGQTCPLQTRKSVKCYPLCVTDIGQCPALFVPKCKPGWSFCNDGSCHKSCTGIPNVCSCSSSPLLKQYKPCSITPTVDVPNYNKSNIVKEVDSQLLSICNEQYNIVNTIPWTNDALFNEQLGDASTSYWATCKPPVARFTYREPMFIAVFSYFSCVFVAFVLWVLYKKLRETNIDKIMMTDDSSLNFATSEKRSDRESKSTDKKQRHMIKGYNNDYFGSLVFYSFIVLSAGFIIWLSVVTADYYGDINGTEFGIALSSYDLSSNMFIGIWISATTWFVFMNVFRHRLRNFFRIECYPLNSKYIQIEKRIITTYMLDDGSKILDLVRKTETSLKRMLRLDYALKTVALQKSKSKEHFYFNYQCLRYVFNKSECLFQPFDFYIGNTCEELFKLKKGLSTVEAKKRVELKGPNFITVEVPSFAKAMAQEFSSLFYLYQIMIMWLFYYFAYYEVGLVDTAVIFISAFIKVVIRLKSEKRIKSMAEHVSEVTVYRDNKWIELPTSDLVPGDVFQVQDKTQVPVDAVVLSGNIVADESSLTGEPLPIRKFPIKDESTSYDRSGSNKINSLFAGTNIAQAIPTENNGHVTALVYQTSTSTDKGQLIHKILFPSPISFIFDEQLKIVICILGLWGIVLFCLSIVLQHKNLSASWFYGMFCLSQILSPLLPAALVVGQSVSAAQLRKKKIFCIDLPRITVAGKVQMFCFDKTGTLTKEGLEFYGGQPTKTVLSENIDKNVVDSTFIDFNENHNSLPSIFQLGTAACHSVTEVNGSKIGNPVDIEMFNATGWKIHEPETPEYVDTIKNNEAVAHIIKRYEFVHARMSMSVAVLDAATGNVHIFVKGSFEKVQGLCSPDSVPHNYSDVTSSLAMEGCYVLAMAHRNLGKIDISTIKNWTREKIEEKINMIGLVVFKNKLKDDTADAILQLKDGGTRTIMITGDTALTGIYIARLANLTSQNSQIFLGDVDKNNGIVWYDVETQKHEESENRKFYNTSAIMSMFSKDGLDSNIELAVTGKAFKLLFSSGEMREILLNTRVFARMDPQDKVDCVELHMERGITAMCGDGGNDCGALRAAHVGIALSDAEASIVSPFSSSFRSIQSCVELLKQGRAALAGSFAGYKYLIMYGETMACLKIVTFYFSLNLSSAIWIFIDAFITVLLSVAVTQSKAAPKLAPKRPTARLLGLETLASTFGQVFINFLFVAFAFVMLYHQKFFVCNEFDSNLVDIAKWYTLGDNFEAQTLAFVTIFQFINSAAIFNFGYYFRETWIKNYSLVFMWSFLVTGMSCVLLLNPNSLGCMFRLNCGDPDVLKEIGYSVPKILNSTPYNIPLGHNVYPVAFRYKLWGYIISNMIAGVAFEKFIVLGPLRQYLSKSRPLDRLKIKI